MKSNKKVIIVLSLTMIGYVTLTTIIGAFCSVFQVDDFSNANVVATYIEGGHSQAWGALEYTKHVYLTWQGTWSTIFLQSLITPLNNSGIMKLNIILAINCLLFFAALLYFMWVILKKIKNMCIILAIYACVVFALMNYKAWTEIFFWLTGAAIYCVPITCALASASLLISANLYNNRKIYLNYS